MKVTPAMAAAPLFRGIPAARLGELLACMGAVCRHFRRGELILRRGRPGGRLGLVLSGAVHIVKEDFWGNRTIVGLAEPGRYLRNHTPVWAQSRWRSPVLAAADTEVLFLDAGRAVTGCGRGCAAHSQLSRNLLALLAGRNLALTRKMGHMARRTTRDKVLSFLSAQALRSGGPEFDIPLDRQQLADYLAVDRSALSAVLGKLRQEGVLTFQKNHFRLLRPEQIPE